MKFIKTILKDLLTKPYKEKEVLSWHLEIVWFVICVGFGILIIGFIIGLIIYLSSLK